MSTIVKKEFPVLKLSCASCANSSETMLKAQEGVKNVSVNFANAIAQIEYDENIIQPIQLKQALQSIGYDLMIEETQEAKENLEAEKKSLFNN